MRSIWLQVAAVLLLVKLRWLGWRLGRRMGLDINGAFRRADAAEKRAQERALLIDPTDRDAMKRAGDQAHADSLDREPRRMRKK
jgi:hypothetical protein